MSWALGQLLLTNWIRQQICLEIMITVNPLQLLFYLSQYTTYKGQAVPLSSHV